MSAQQKITPRSKSIDEIVMDTFEKYTATWVNWGTVIDDELGITNGEMFRIIEELYAEIIPDYFWDPEDMLLLEKLPSVEEFIMYFEGMSLNQQPKPEPMFKFNFD